MRTIVVINKIDRPESRVAEVEESVQDLFLELVTNADQLDFPVLYASAKNGYAISKQNDPPTDMKPLFEAMLTKVPAPIGDPDKPFQMVVTSLDYDSYMGQVAIGRVYQGTASSRAPVVRINRTLEKQSNQLYSLKHWEEKILNFKFLNQNRPPK